MVRPLPDWAVHRGRVRGRAAYVSGRQEPRVVVSISAHQIARHPDLPVSMLRAFTIGDSTIASALASHAS